MTDLEQSQQLAHTIKLATETIEDGLIQLRRAVPAHSAAPLMASILVKLIYETLVKELQHNPKATRSTLLLMMHDIVLEAADEVRETPD